MTTHTICFRSLIKKKLQTFESLGGLDEEEFQNGGLQFFSAGNSWCITTRVRIRHVMVPLVLHIVYRSISEYM